MPADPNPAPTAPSASPGSRAPVVPHRARGKDRVLSWVIGLIFQCLFATMRVRVHDRSGAFEPGRDRRPVLFALWHNRLALALMLHRKLVRGPSGVIARSWPRGPCYTIHDGILTAAKTTGLLIVPVAYTIHWKLRLRSWDRFQVPLPFSRIDLHAAPPLEIPADCDDATRKRLREELRKRMLAITED
jgi:lysophospholipid acyltransferase (LPLAT)-like uncharacterized protein